MKRQILQAIPFAILMTICFWTGWALVGARFVHYHAQRRILAPEHYTADVISVASSSTDERELSKFRKSQDGQYYVRVATLGTAHHLVQTTLHLLPPFLLSLLGAVAAIWIQRRSNAEPNQQVQASR